MIDVKDLSYHYGKGKFEIDGVSFECNGGQVMAILGPNGAGKSTVLKCILDIVKKHQGSVQVNGNEYSALKGNEKAKNIAYVPQTIMFDDMTVFEAILLGRKPYIKLAVTQKDLEIVEGIIQQLQLSSMSQRNVNELSGGERQKVAIGRALAQQAPVMFFDEPTSDLDIKNQLEVLQLIEKIAKENNIAVIINMHDLNLAYRYADNFLLVKCGKVIRADSMSNLTEKDIENVFGVKVNFANLDGKKYIIF